MNRFTHTGLLFLIFFYGAAYSQQSTESDSMTVRFFVKPGDQYRVRVDGQVMPQINQFRLLQGKHKIEIWAPGYNKQTLHITAYSDTVYTITKKLTHTSEYLAYEASQSQFNRKRTNSIILPAITSVALYSTSALLYNYGNNLHKEGIHLKFMAKYSNSTSLRQYYINEYNTVFTKFKRSRQIVYGSLGTAILLSGLVTRNFFVIKKLKRPEFKTKNPFGLTEYSFLILPGGNMMATCKFSF